MSNNLNTPNDILQAPVEPEPQPAKIVLIPSSDAMQLEVVFHRAIDAPTIPPTFEDVMALLEEEGVTYGINDSTLRAICFKVVYDTPFVIATGREPRTGADGSIKYLVETKRDMRPKMREDGTVDYRDIGFVQNVKKGQLLCEITLPEKGADGFDIYSNLRDGRYGKSAINPSGRNTVTNEEGTELRAACDGSVEVHAGVVDVIDVLRIPGNVDNATGDITFVGDIVVDGDVVSGFNVTAERSITIKGSVEGATIKAGDNIVVGEGINGRDRGSVIAGGSIKCQYIQSCFIRADGHIYADSIMYCTLECSGNVVLDGKRGALIGGHCSIAGKLSAKTIGTESHVATNITMASTGVEKEREIQALREALKRIDEETRKILQLMARFDDLIKQNRLPPEQQQNVLAVKNNYLAIVQRRTDTQKRLDQVKAEQMEASRENSFIECRGRIHSGVQVTFGPLTMKVKTSTVNRRISVINKEIRFS